MRRPIRASVLAILLAVCAPPVALTQSAPPDAASASAQPDYHPSMGDLMTMAIQPRHIKLYYAGDRQNWGYAGYELGELRNAFARIARTIPQYHALGTADITAAVTQAPLDALARAIKARSPEQFTVAYAQLTQACNACHQSLNHPDVVIKVPPAGMFPDQDFQPEKLRSMSTVIPNSRR
jgi:hypothetical protein